MGLFNNLFNSNSDNKANGNTKKRSNSVNSGSSQSPKPLDIKTPTNTLNDRKSPTPSSLPVSRNSDKSDTLNNMTRIRKANTTGQLIHKKTVDISNFLDYWTRQNLAMFHPEKNKEEYMKYKPGSGSDFTVIESTKEASTPVKRKSCFKHGTLVAYKKFLHCQQARLNNERCRSRSSSISVKDKTKTNLSKILFGSSSKNSTSNENANNIPLRKWSSQPNYTVDKECEYDLYGMQDYYDNEDHSKIQQYRRSRSGSMNSDLQLIENTRANSTTSVLSYDSMNDDKPMNFLKQFPSDDDSSSDEDSDLNIPMISPVNSISGIRNDYKSFKIPPGLEETNIPKHIHFDKTVFTADPPQQICSKQPRKGDVVVTSEGIVVVNNRNKKQPGEGCSSPSDCIDGVGRGSHGLTVGGRGVLRLLSDEDREALTEHLEWRYFKDLNEIKGENIKTLPDIEIDAHADEFDNKMFPNKDRNVTWREIYQRICHLREILPIASILQQIPEELPDPDTNEIQYTSYIPMITLKNNKPSMIEILTLCDFISCTVVETLIFDMCDMSLEMFTRIINAVTVMLKNIQAILESKTVKVPCGIDSIKLSFRNTPISEDGYKVLCKFFSTFDFKPIKLSLDISIAPGVKTNVLRKKNIHCEDDKVTDRMSMKLKCNQGKRISEINDFDYDMTCRDADWTLFIASIACNPSLILHHLFLNNCGIYDPNRKNYGYIVQNFFENVAVKTLELGESKKDIEQLLEVALKSQADPSNGIPAEKVKKCEILSRNLLEKLDAGTTQFNIRKLLVDNDVLDFPSLKPENQQPECSTHAGKRNILIDQALLGDDVRSYSINKDEENEVIPILSKNGSFDHFSEEFQDKIKSSHEHLLKLNESNIRDMIKH